MKEISSGDNDRARLSRAEDGAGGGVVITVLWNAGVGVDLVVAYTCCVSGIGVCGLDVTTLIIGLGVSVVVFSFRP